MLQEPLNLWDVLAKEMKVRMQDLKSSDQKVKDYDKVLRALVNAGVKLTLTTPGHQNIASSNEFHNKGQGFQKHLDVSQNKTDTKPYKQGFQQRYSEVGEKPYRQRFQKPSNAFSYKTDKRPDRQGSQQRYFNEEKSYRQEFQKLSNVPQYGHRPPNRPNASCNRMSKTSNISRENNFDQSTGKDEVTDTCANVSENENANIGRHVSNLKQPQDRNKGKSPRYLLQSSSLFSSTRFALGYCD